MVLTYAALVGLPLAGLAAVLHAGAGLQAPPDIAGVWQVQPVPGRPGFGITVSQSGTRVSLLMGAVEYRGVFRGDSIVARSTTQVEPRACRGLRAFIDTVAAVEMMTIPSDECGPGASASRIPERR